ncbi:oxysterol-binding protein-related protein 10 isoform X2 [Eublepharis macularius]|uniref:Oxysterol-binding protein n=1 Tax=Eublepharis macularius TaxID=481883 RepID=A0AA97K2A3_EUBMA|nr:oxysterol-binding protein-related protein 10 isoform X2 [Eublepharis macularius]
MEKATAQGGPEGAAAASGGSNSSSRSSSRPASAASSPSSSAGRGLAGRQAAAAGRPDGGGGSSSSPSSAAASPGGGLTPGRRTEPVLEGTLSKYTNLLQGWQSRYFMLDFDTGILQYFVNEQSKNQKPRGVLSLAGAVVSLSDEAPNMLVVYSANGEMYKLKAGDARERQYWVTQLRSCAKYHTEGNSKSSSSSRMKGLSLFPHGSTNSTSPSSQKILNPSGPPVVTITHHKSPAVARKAKALCPGHLHEVREMMSQVEGQQKSLVQAIESLPGSGPLSALDQDLLLLKATSAATLSCLGECLHLLQQGIHQVSQHSSNRSLASENILGWHGPKSHSAEPLKNGALSSLTSASASLTWAIVPTATQEEHVQPATECSAHESILVEEEMTDTEDNAEDDLGVMEDQRSIILHLISQLKLGMDLTRVVLPTFILEKRSLLEMYANFLAHPDLFLSIASGTTPEDRIINFVEYYLTAFHEGRKGAVAKKPYNPIIGETFHCSWDVPKDKVKQSKTHSASAAPKDQVKGVGQDPSACYKLRFVAEQVSHHPPVSCFYCECKEKKVCANVHVWTKSKFMGMSVGVSMVGEGVLHLLEHEEEYVFTLPSAYARSILTIPWVELGGKVNIHCAKSGYSATVTFHTKPFYGGKVHRVTAEVKHNPTNTIVCKAQGEWNGVLEFIYSNGETKIIDTAKLPIIRKKIRPIAKQGPFESRHLWQHVTRALKEDNIIVATEHKHLLEERQRAEERQREVSSSPWKPKYFIKEGDGWLYFDPLWKTH